MIGERLDSIDLDTLGVVGDRAWAARDLERGGIRGAKKIGALMELAAADVGDGHVEITLPDGSTVRSTDADVDERLSAALEHPVRLEALRPATELDHYRRGEPDSDDFMAELRGVFGRLDDEPLPDLSVFPEAVLEYESPPGTYYDAYPLMVMTEQALSALASAVPGSVVDVRRFRPSFVIDAGDTSTPNPGHPEFDWVGRSARIGSAVVEFIAACPRCVMITRRIDDTTPQDRAVLRHVVRDLDQNVGVYANITTPGTIKSGDSVTLI
jgi:uncharacterized protein YcbX